MSQENLELLIAHLRRHAPGLVAVYLYGSAVRDGLRPDSDLDVGILLPPGADLAPEQRLALASELGSLAGRPVDLAVLGRPAGAVLGKEVVTSGRRLWDDGSTAVDEFEMYALGAYARLREDRAAVEAAYSLRTDG